MDQQIENRCLGLVENYRILSAGSKLEFQEMVLACAGIYLAAGMEPDMGRVQECKKLLKSRAGLFSISAVRMSFWYAARWRLPMIPRSILKGWSESISVSKPSSAESRPFSPP